MGRVVPSRTTLGCVQIPSDVTLEDEGPPFAEQMGIDIQMTHRVAELHADTDHHSVLGVAPFSPFWILDMLPCCLTRVRS